MGTGDGAHLFGVIEVNGGEIGDDLVIDQGLGWYDSTGTIVTAWGGDGQVLVEVVSEPSLLALLATATGWARLTRRQGKRRKRMASLT